MKFKKHDCFVFDFGTCLEILDIVDGNTTIIFKIDEVVEEYAASEPVFKLLWLGEDGNSTKPIGKFNRKILIENLEFNVW